MKEFNELEFIKENLGAEGFYNYCVGNLMKVTMILGGMEPAKAKEALKRAFNYLDGAVRALEEIVPEEKAATAAKKPAVKEAKTAPAKEANNDDGWN